MRRSFNAYAIAIAATALLLAIPSTARAGYPDGMNRYGAYHVMHGGVDPSGLWTREKDTGHVWCAESGDTLSGLAAMQEYGGNGQNWPCLWPTEDTKDHGYPNTIQPGDKYDASNLAVPSPSASALKVSVAPEKADAYGKWYGTTHLHPDRVAEKIQDTSGQGATPISTLIVAGHSGSNGMSGWKKSDRSDIARFTTAKLVALSQPPIFARAKQQQGPIRCWFTRDAEARFPGCHSSEVMAKPFAEEVLRKGATSWGTTVNTGHGTRSFYYRETRDGPKVYADDPLKAPIWQSWKGEQ